MIGMDILPKNNSIVNRFAHLKFHSYWILDIIAKIKIIPAFLTTDCKGVIGIYSPKQPQFPDVPYCLSTKNKYNVNAVNKAIETAMATFFILKWIMNRMPKKNSNPIRILADHSAIVQLKKVVSTIVQPNCSKVGILENAEKTNTEPIVRLKIVNNIFLYCGFKRMYYFKQM